MTEPRTEAEALDAAFEAVWGTDTDRGTFGTRQARWLAGHGWRLTNEAAAQHPDAGLRKALDVLDEDSNDANRHTMWRFGVRHSLTVIRRALADTPSEK